MLIDATVTNLEEQPGGSPAPEVPVELVDPTTGEILDLADADTLISSFERVSIQANVFWEAKRKIAHAIAKLTEGEAKTRRVRGKERGAKVEMPDDAWVQSILKEVWNAYPKLRDDYLRIESVGVKLREWKKLKETSGEPDLEQLKKMLAQANMGPTGTPRVTVEK
jgi:hypothetical protein